MHEAEVEVDDDVVRQLLRDQQPVLATRTLTRVDAWGTDHVVYRLGDDLAVRLPKIDWAAGQAAKEHRWLPELAPHLPVEVPIPVLVGAPGAGYPFPWCVSPWLPGEHPAVGPGVDHRNLALALAAFVRALHDVDPSGGPAPAPGRRGGPLRAADPAIGDRAEQLRGQTDVDGLLEVWAAGIDATPWDGPPCWVHGDLSDGNLLLCDGRLTGVIDWGALVVGDPAVDLMPAWTLFDGEARDAYREAVGEVDDAMWSRGRAWAVAAAILALPYYRSTNPEITARSWRTVRVVLADVGDG